MNFISSYMYVTFIRFVLLGSYILFYGGGCDGVGRSVHSECNAKRRWVKIGRGVE